MKPFELRSFFFQILSAPVVMKMSTRSHASCKPITLALVGQAC
jgi:hypothetical protein